MNVWIINPYGTLPSEGWREYRSSLIARALAKRGHTVVWWISNFEHRSKSYRKKGFLSDSSLTSNINIISVPSTSYSKNISLLRIRYELIFGWRFLNLAEKMTQPDLIILADPSLFYSKPVVKYAKKVGSKIVLDILDLWPEQFQVALPDFLRPFGKLFLLALYIRRQRLVNLVDAVVAVTKNHLSTVNPPKCKPSLVAYLGLDLKKFMVDSKKSVSDYIQNFVKESDLVIVYAGTLGDAYDMTTLISAAQRVIHANNKIKFIFAGDGPFAYSINSLSECFSKNILFVGNLSAHKLPAIYKLCDIGICSYSKDSTVTMPVKLYDYLAGNLFILYSIGGEIDDLMYSNSCGIRYEPGDSEKLSELILGLTRNSIIKQCLRRPSTIAKNFDQQIQYSNYVDFIEKVTKFSFDNSLND